MGELSFVLFHNTGKRFIFLSLFYSFSVNTSYFVWFDVKLLWTKSKKSWPKLEARNLRKWLNFEKRSTIWLLPQFHGTGSFISSLFGSNVCVIRQICSRCRGQCILMFDLLLRAQEGKCDVCCELKQKVTKLSQQAKHAQLTFQ